MHPGAVDTQNEESPLLGSGRASLKGNTVYIYVVACLSAIGGFLFGYDTGIISGAMIFIRDYFDLNEWWQESIVSSTLLAAWVFSIMSGSATDKFGRKPVIVGSSVIFVLGALLMAVAWNAVVLLAGRLVVGAGVGLASMTVPMYIAEVAPSGIRGQLVMINMCCITGGQFCASIIAYAFSYIKGGHEWRYMLGFAALPAAIQFVAFLFMPESPRWLISHKRYEEARRVLRRIRPAHCDTGAEFEAIRANCRRNQRERDALKDPDQSVAKRVLATQPVRKALLVGCLLQVIQQTSGINTVMYYTASIFEMAGIRSKREALLLSSGAALVNFVFTIVGYALVERMGRRKLTLFSLFGVILGLLTLAAGFQVAYHNSPPVSYLNSSAEAQPCGLLPNCAACAREPACGFCFRPEVTTTTAAQASALTAAELHEEPSLWKAVAAATCLPVNLTHHDQSATGSCASPAALKLDGQSNTDTAQQPATSLVSQVGGFVWAYEWCPSAYSWITLLGMVMYLFFFAPGMGPMPWTINSEIYPVWARSWCLSASTSVCWLFNLLVSMTFLSLTRAITKQGAFYLYAGFATLGFLYFLFVLPETRGKSLEELEYLFADKQWIKERGESVGTAGEEDDDEDEAQASDSKRRLVR